MNQLSFSFLFFLITSVMSSQDYYVDDQGNDSNPGSESLPFKTINKAIEAVEAGGTVFVMDGIYDSNNPSPQPTPSILFQEVSGEPNEENTDSAGNKFVDSNCENVNNPPIVTIDKAGNSSAGYITLKNYPGDKPKIVFTGQGGIKLGPNANYIIVEGFEVEGPSQSISYDQAIMNRRHRITLKERDNISNNQHTYFSGKGIWGVGSDEIKQHIIIRNNIVHDTPGSGIRFNDCDYVTIEGNIVYNTTWWTSSASSAIVFAETNAINDTDNTTDIKMIMRGNIVYNNWNRIPFYMASFPDFGNPPSGNYGNASYSKILDGQGLYVTRSNPEYIGTFLFENNLCVNNGKNGINFDRSYRSSAIIRNNTIYFNGVHEIIQDISEIEELNPAHRGQNVGGIIANYVRNVTVANNIVVGRNPEVLYQKYPNWCINCTDSNQNQKPWEQLTVSEKNNYNFSTLKLNNIDNIDTPNPNFLNDDDLNNDGWPDNADNDGIKIANNNIFLDGSTAYPGNDSSSPHNNFIYSYEYKTNDQFDASDLFKNPITFSSNSSINMDTFNNYLVGSDFSLKPTSIAIDNGDENNSPTIDIEGNPRPVSSQNIVSSSSFETSFDGWVKWSNENSTNDIALSEEDSKHGNKSIKVFGRTQNWHSAKFDLDFLENGNNYSIYLWVKGTEDTGTAQLRVKKTNSGESTYQDITDQININQNEWTLLSGDYTHSQNEDSFLYVKGPSVISEIGADFFIDNFSLVVAGSPEVDFSSVSDIVDIGAYEYIETSLSIYDRGNEIKSNHDITLFPNPVSNELHLINLDLQSKIKIIDVSGRKYDVKTIQNLEQDSIKIDLSHLKSGTYIIQILSEKGTTKSFKIMKQ